MKVCAACNPISELLTDENGELYCRFHGKEYRMEEINLDAVIPAEVPAETPPEAV